MHHVYARSYTRAPNCRASRRTHQKGGKLDGHLDPKVCDPRRCQFRQTKRSQRTGRLGALSLAQPTARRPCQRFKVPSVRKVVPSETRKRRSSDRSLRSTLAICSGGLDSVPLLAQWQLSTNSPASCLSITANGLRKKLVSPALCGANEQFYRSSTSAKKSTLPK